MAKYHADALDAEGEIMVRELEELPRRLAVARLLDRYEGGAVFGGTFSQYTPAQWVNRADRRYWRLESCGYLKSQANIHSTNPVRYIIF